MDIFKSGAMKELMYLLFLPLATPFHLIATFPQVIITATSRYFDIRMLLIHYSSSYIPFVFYSFLLFLNNDSFFKFKFKNIKFLNLIMVLIFIIGNSVGGGYIRYNKVHADYDNLEEIMKMIDVNTEYSCIQGPLVPHFIYSYKENNVGNIRIFTKKCIDNFLAQNYLFNLNLGNFPFKKSETQEFIRILETNNMYKKTQVGEFILFHHFTKKVTDN
ncbi:MAG: hypothetical protein HQK51_20415 [Oligoflexia bacterium]|nr:hypothetical protein [Oligoflexia bacterium]